MITYVYECSKCSARFTKEQSIKDDPITKCEVPFCDGKVRRVVAGSPPALRKGEGWASNDGRNIYHETSTDKYRAIRQKWT